MATVNWRLGAATQTELQWQTENPILLAGEIAVSSDQLYTGTDQRKFKMGNGTDRWNALDYMPVGGGSSAIPTLEDVRSEDSIIAGSITGLNTGHGIDLDNTDPGTASAMLYTSGSYVYVNDGQVFIGDKAQNVGIYANIVAEDAGLFNPSGALTLTASGDVSVTSKKVIDVANGTNANDAVNKSQLDGKQNTITTGITSQYFRGDLSLATLDKTAVGLGNVDNTSDANKPLSTATQTALNAKQDTLVSGTNIKTIEGQSLIGSGNIDLTKSDVGLSNVDNTSDANKPVSTAQATAIALKQDQLNGTGFVKATGTTISYDNTAYTAVGADINQHQLNHANGFYAFTDCTGAGDLNFSVQVSGSGTAGTAAAVPFTIQPAVGVTGFTMGTVATNRVAYASPSMVDTLFFGQGAAYYVARFAVNTLSDATNTYTSRIGFIDSVTGESVDGAFFRYTHSVNSGRWQCVTRANGVETATDSGVTAVAGTWNKFEVEVNSAGTSVAFKVNGTTVQTHTTNIPTGSGRGTSYGNMVLRSVGTAIFTSLLIDFAMCRQIFTSSR